MQQRKNRKKINCAVSVVSYGMCVCATLQFARVAMYVWYVCDKKDVLGAQCRMITFIQKKSKKKERLTTVH